ncbi:class I lanthipeptide [Kordia sp.]|uniref:class I lanthipeptide n=1 Tax=Kordia sp. TaxID=1965332 RepID=UPI003D6A80F7
MKKKKIKGLSLNKKSISSLNKDQLQGGASAFCTNGCSDGCSPFQTAWNCTRGNCTNDCTDGYSWICTLLIGCVDDEN